MKLFRTLAVAAAMSSLAGAAISATVDVKYTGTAGETVKIHNGVKSSPGKQNVQAGEFSFASTAMGGFVAYCVDLATDLVTNKSKTVNYQVTNSLFDSGTTASVQNLFDANYSGVSTNSDKAAFQMALWKTLYGDKFSYVSGGSSGLANKVDGYLNAANSWSGGRVWELTFLANSAPKSQNLVNAELAPVPLPAAGFLLLGGLGGLGVLARRRRKTA